MHVSSTKAAQVNFKYELGNSFSHFMVYFCLILNAAEHTRLAFIPSNYNMIDNGDDSRRAFVLTR